MAAAAAGAAAAASRQPDGLLGMDQVQWMNAMMRQVIAMYHASQAHGGGVGLLMDRPDIFR